jgi:YVTN family beta-propeller protein
MGVSGGLGFDLGRHFRPFENPVPVSRASIPGTDSAMRVDSRFPAGIKVWRVPHLQVDEKPSLHTITYSIYSLGYEKDMTKTRSCAFVLLFLASLATSCGGGGGGSTNSSPPPPAADFQMTFGTNPLPILQGEGTAEQVNLTALNGFTGNITLSYSSLPSGVTVNPPGPTTVSYNESFGASFSASSSAAPGSSTVILTGTSGSISHSIPLTIQINAAPSFQLSLNPSSLTIKPNTSTNVQVSYTGTLPQGSQVAVDIPSQIPGLPGVTVSGAVYLTPTQPTGTFQIISAIDAPNASNVPIQVSGVSGPTEVSINLVVSVDNSFPSSGALSRSTFRRTDMDPTSAVYDPVRKQVFTAVPQLNEVVVYSSMDAHTIATIPVPAPGGIDISADGSQLIVASRTETFCIVDPALLQLETCKPVAFASSPVASPETLEPQTLANGNVLFTMTDQEGGGSGLYEWSAVTGNFSNVTPPVIGPGVVSFSRSADHSTIAIAGQTGIALFSSASDKIVATSTFSAGFGSIAVNPGGTAVAVVTSGPEGSNAITLFDSLLNPLATYSINSQSTATGLLFSRDGGEIYVLAEGLIICFNAQTLVPIGLVPAQGLLGFPSDADETGMIFAPEAQGRGLGFFDASSPRALGTDSPVNAGLSPPQGSPTSPGTTTVSAVQGLTSGSSFYFGAPPASPQETPGRIVSIAPPGTAQVVPPPHAAGTVNVTITNPDGQLSVLPDAYSYGPTVVAMSPNAGPASGQTSVTLMGYGLDFPQSQIKVTVAGQPATVTYAFPGAPISPFPFPMDTIKFTVPAGVHGFADVTVTTPAGSITSAQSFQYLNSIQSFPVSGGLGKLIYDQPRQRLYATNYATNQVNVFDLQSQQIIASINVGLTPAGLSLTPDGTKLVVANFGDGTVSIINPSTLSVSATLPMPASVQGCGVNQPLLVAITSTNLAVISGGCSAVLAGQFEILNLNTQTFGCDTSTACSQFLTLFNSMTSGAEDSNVSASADGTKVFATYNGNGIIGDLPVVLWDVSNDTVTSQTSFGTSEAAADADGTLFLGGNVLFAPDMYFRFYLQDVDYLQAAGNSPSAVLGEKLHPSGSLAYLPQANGIDIFDVHRGRLVRRVALPFQMQSILDEMAVDETGARIFCITTTGISIVQVGELPLSIGTVSPSSAPSGGGAALVIRGSGFQTGLTLQVGTATVAANVSDASTINFSSPALAAGAARVTVTNPDGTTYTLDGAIQIR